MKKWFFSIFVVIVLSGCTSTCVNVPLESDIKGSSVDQLFWMNPVYKEKE